MAKQISYDANAREHIKNGVVKLARAVKVTLGPRGRNVIIEKSFGSPTVTKDGVTVSKEVDLEDPYENMGAQLVKQVASQTNDQAGDGTTTATVLAEAIFLEGLKNVTAGANPVALKRGIDKAVAACVDHLEKSATKIKGSAEIAQVGSIAANNDVEIGKMLAKAMERVGNDGVITVEDGRTSVTDVEWVEGMQFDKGFLSPHFITNPKSMAVELENPYILIHEKKLSSVKDMIPLLEQVAQSGRPLLIIAEDIEGEALATLVVNRLRGAFPCCAVKAPGFGDRRKAMMEDIACLVGANPVFEATGGTIEGVVLADLGTAKKVVVTKDDTTIIEGSGKKDAIKGRIEQIRAEIEDALHATRAAVEEGIVAGGGVALLATIEAVEKLKLEGDERVGAMIIRRALEAPIRQIASNAGQDGSVIVQNIRAKATKNYGYNAATDVYEDLVKAGVIDPKKVVRTALQNAASVASLLLTTDALVSELPKNEKEPMGAH